MTFTAAPTNIMYIINRIQNICMGRYATRKWFSNVDTQHESPQNYWCFVDVSPFPTYRMVSVVSGSIRSFSALYHTQMLHL